MDEIKTTVKEAQQQNLQRAIEFLKFAEAKNAAAVAFSSALILTILQYRAGVTALLGIEKVALILCFLGGLVSVRSFIPQLNPRSFLAMRQETTQSLIYFGDIASFSAAEFGEKFSERYRNIDNLIEDLSIQCSIVSKIAVDKMNHFTWSLLLTVSGVVCLVISLAMELFVG